MKRYDVSCPCCGYRNINLYLEETDGFMECARCGELTQVSKRFMRLIKIPAFRIKDPEQAALAGCI